MSILNNTTALQNEQTELQSLLEQVNALPEAENLDDVISTQDDLISQIQDTVNSLPEASSGGGSYGVCPSVTISANVFAIGEDFILRNIMYSYNGEYYIHAEYDIEYGGYHDEDFINQSLMSSPYVIHDIDINKPIMIEVETIAQSYPYFYGSTNIAHKYTNNDGYIYTFICMITDTNPAEITISD